MSILSSWFNPLRNIFLFFDSIAFSLLDNVFNLFVVFAENQVFSENSINSMIDSIYVLVGLISFFRLAMLLVNSIIDPDKLLEKKQGLSGIFGRVIAMIILLIISPLIFRTLNEFQGKIVRSNIIFRTILNSAAGDVASNSNNNNFANSYFVNAGKTMQKIVATSLIKPEDDYFNDGEAGVIKFLGDANGVSKLDEYVNSDCNSKCKDAMERYYNTVNTKDKLSLLDLQKYIGSGEKIVNKVTNEKETVYFYEYLSIITTICAGFLTYVILSWSIDIAVRSVELAVLRVVSPLFIATIVDPKSTADGGYFNNWLKRYMHTYADLFLKLAIIAVAILLISLVQDAEIWNTVVGG